MAENSRLNRIKRSQRKTKARARLIRKNLKQRFSGWTFKATPMLTADERQSLMESYTELLKNMVEIDSQTLNIEGVNKVQKQLAKYLTEIGFSCEWFSNPETESGDFLKAELKGQSSEFITIVAHGDTVLSPFGKTPFEFFENDHKVRGSGVIDNKGGLIVALGGLDLFLARHKPYYSIRFVSSPNEEMGSVGFLENLRACAEDSAFALGFEPSLEDGSIVESRRGNRWYNITIQGKEAHAGRSKGQHVNAAHEFAKKISLLHKLNDYKKNIAVNIGAVQGGRDRHNITCGEVHAKLDVRFASFRDREAVHKSIEKIFDKKYVKSVDGLEHADTSYEIVDDCPPFSCSKKSKNFVRKYTKIIGQIEANKCLSVKAGGAGDVNYMSKKGVVVLDGLGPKGGQMHTENEFIYLPSLVTRAEAFASFLEYVNK